MPAHVYVDAFNLYYRRLKGTEFTWLDLGQMTFMRAVETTASARGTPLAT